MPPQKTPPRKAMNFDGKHPKWKINFLFLQLFRCCIWDF